MQHLTTYLPARFGLSGLSVILVGILAFTSCKPKEKTSFSHVVTMPKLPPELTFELKEGCEWERVDFAVFNEKDQRLKFRYQKCSSITHIKSDLVGYNEVQTETGLPLLVIGKQGPHTPQEHMGAMIPKTTTEVK